MRKFSILVLFSIQFVNSFSQELLQSYRSKYPDKQAVMIKKREEVRITLGKNDSLEITLTYNSEMLHLADRTEGLAEGSVSYSDFVQITSLDAKTMVPHKSSFKAVKVSEFQVKTPGSAGIFYDDNKLKVFNYPAVQPGAKTVLSYSQKLKEPRLLFPYYFNSYVPVEETELVVYVDNRIKLGHRIFNNKDNKISFNESSQGNFTVYKWSGKNLQEYTMESNAPNLSYHEAHVVYFIEEVNYSGKKETLFKETKDLYNWYYGMAIQSQKPVGKDLKAIVDSLVQGVASPVEKTRKIYYWVQDHVSYVAFEEGYGGFIPRDADLVCDRRFGDCKDMANLLVQMLNTAGVPAYHTWIGTRDIPYSYQQLPATNVDNHMIAAVKVDGDFIFLDATGKHGYLKLPTSMIQGKEALIGIGKEQFEIVKVPVMDPYVNHTKDSVYFKLNNNVLTGNGRVTAGGYTKIDFTYSHNYSKKENQKDQVKEFVTKGSNKFLLNTYDLKNLAQKEKPLVIDYDFRLEDYAKISGNELYINLNLNRSFDKDRIDTAKRKLPLEFEHKYVREDVSVFEIPAGYKVDYLPENVSEKNPFFEFYITYKTTSDNKIVYTKKIVLNTLLLEKKDFNDYNKVINKLSQAYREVVVLKN